VSFVAPTPEVDVSDLSEQDLFGADMQPHSLDFYNTTMFEDDYQCMLHQQDAMQDPAPPSATTSKPAPTKAAAKVTKAAKRRSKAPAVHEEHDDGEESDDVTGSVIKKLENRRINNNLSAVKSRQKRRDREEENRRLVVILEKENTELKARLTSLEDEAAYLRAFVMSLAAKDGAHPQKKQE